MVNIHEAKTQFSRIVARAAAGETIVISRAGTPVVKVSAINTPITPRRLGFLEGEASIPHDFDEWGGVEIAELFDRG